VIPNVNMQGIAGTCTKILAQNITKKTGVETFEGEDGMAVENGKAYVAPGGSHMKLVKDGLSLKIALDDGPQENFFKPSVEPMMRSALEAFGNKVLGVMLTGMGNDGVHSAKTLAEANGRMIAQDEATSVIWGMPGAVAKAGLCAEVLPLNDIGPWVRKAVLG